MDIVYPKSFEDMILNPTNQTIPFLQPQHCRFNGARPKYWNGGFFGVPEQGPLRFYKSNDDVRIENTIQEFSAFLNLEGFDVNNIKVSYNENFRLLTVEAKKNIDFNSKDMERHFKRSIEIPHDCDIKKLKSFLDKNGELSIIAPKLRPVQDVRENSEALMQNISQENDDKSKCNSKKVSDSIMEIDEPSSDQISEAKKDFEYTISLKAYQPDEIEVFVNETGLVTIKANHEEKDHTDGSILTEQLTKKIEIDPLKYHLDKVISKLNKSGILSITIPIKLSESDLALD